MIGLVVHRQHEVTVATGPYAPGWLLRLSGPAVAVGCAAITDASSELVLITVGLAVLTAIWPAGLAPTTLALVLGLLTLSLPSEPYDFRALLLLAGVHLTLQLTALAGCSSWRCRVELSALAPPLRRYLIIQAFVQPLALIAGLLRAEHVSVAWLPAVGGLALTGTVLWLLARLRRKTATPSRWSRGR